MVDMFAVDMARKTQSDVRKVIMDNSDTMQRGDVEDIRAAMIGLLQAAAKPSLEVFQAMIGSERSAAMFGVMLVSLERAEAGLAMTADEMADLGEKLEGILREPLKEAIGAESTEGVTKQ